MAWYQQEYLTQISMVVRVGPPATIGCEPRQARKGAAVVTDSGAGVWLAWAATLFAST
jgi:hypothetical protein